MDTDAHESIDRLIKSAEPFLRFWTDVHGWAPPYAAELLAAQKAAWFKSLIHNLNHFAKDPPNAQKIGHLILGYACLRSLTEYMLKIFFCVYQSDYETGDKTFISKGKLIDPPDLQYEQLRQLWVKKIDITWQPFLSRIQNRGNAIHSYNHRDLGDYSELKEDIINFEQFFYTVNQNLPYPE